MGNKYMSDVEPILAPWRLAWTKYNESVEEHNQLDFSSLTEDKFKDMIQDELSGATDMQKCSSDAYLQLAKIRPPKELQKTHAALVKSLGQTAQGYLKLKSYLEQVYKMRKGDESIRRKADELLSEAERLWQQVIDELDKYENKFTAEPASTLPLLDAALESCVRTACDIAEHEFQRAMWASWALGGSSIFDFDSKDTAFTKKPDNLYKAKLLLELGMQAMVSFWFWNWYSERSVSRDERDDAIKVSLLNIQTLLDVSSKDTLNLYQNFDKQLQFHFEEAAQARYLSYVDMFYQRYWECVTGEHTVDWVKLSFPVKSHQQYSDSYRRGYRSLLSDLTKAISLWGNMTIAAAGMFRHFNENFKAE